MADTIELSKQYGKQTDKLSPESESKITYVGFLEKYFEEFSILKLQDTGSPTESTEEIRSRLDEQKRIKESLILFRESHPSFLEALEKTVNVLKSNKNAPIPFVISKIINNIDQDLYPKAKKANDPIIDLFIKIKQLKSTFKDTYIVDISQEIGLHKPSENATSSTNNPLNLELAPTTQHYLNYKEYISKKSIPTKTKPLLVQPVKQNIWQKTWSWLKKPWW